MILPHSTPITHSAQTKSSSSHYSNVKRLYSQQGASLVILGIVAGGILSLNLLLSLIYVQRKPLAVLRAVGATRRGVVGVAIVQALVIATSGYLLGIGATPCWRWYSIRSH